MYDWYFHAPKLSPLNPGRRYERPYQDKVFDAKGRTTAYVLGKLTYLYSQLSIILPLNCSKKWMTCWWACAFRQRSAWRIWLGTTKNGHVGVERSSSMTLNIAATFISKLFVTYRIDDITVLISSHPKSFLIVYLLLLSSHWTKTYYIRIFRFTNND